MPMLFCDARSRYASLVVGCALAMQGCKMIPDGWECTRNSHCAPSGWACMDPGEIPATGHREVILKPRCFKLCNSNLECDRERVCLAGVCLLAEAGTGGTGGTCDDGLTNQNEPDVDCGGPCPTKCKTGNRCLNDSDCESDVCDAQSHCALPTCSDFTHNGAETDVDCGGACPKCADEKLCATAADCQSGVCSASATAPNDKCCAVPTCNDLVQNSQETDVDCGGSGCPPCPDDGACIVGSDCQSKVCDGTHCQAPTCTDSAKNGEETDVNCGGPACEPCAEGAGCALDVDCQSQICTADVTAKCPNGQPCCQVPACGNGFKSAGETDVDCGGSVCDRCALGKACLYSSDCESSYCYQGTCTALRLAAGGKHTCALTSTGAVRCWGDGSVGQLGYGNTMGKGASPGQMPPPNVDVGSSPLVQITAGGAHTCGVTADGQLKCWGDGKFGALGYGNTTLLIVGDDEAPGASNVGYVGLGAGTTVAQVSAGGGQTCVRNVSGALGVWGNFCDVSSPFPCNSTSYFGDNEPALTLFDGQLLEMATGVHAAQIALGAFHGCAITRGGAIRCWGHMGGGQLGFGDTQPRMPFIVEGSEPFVDLGRGVIAVQIAAGGAHTCVLIRSAAVKCWGSSEQGQLGLGHTATIGDGTVPMPPPDVDLGVGFSTIQLAAGDEHTCALSQDGDVRCWGSGLHGQLGYGNTHNIGDEPSEMPPQNVDLGANIKAAQLVAGAQHTCVLTTAGSVKCWGQGTYGQLGYGNTNAIGASVTPATVGFVAVE